MQGEEEVSSRGFLLRDGLLEFAWLSLFDVHPAQVQISTIQLPLRCLALATAFTTLMTGTSLTGRVCLAVPCG